MIWRCHCSSTATAQVAAVARVQSLAEELSYDSAGPQKKKLDKIELLAAHFFYFSLFRAAPVVYTSSQARGQIGAAAASLHHSHSNARSKVHLQPMLQLVATPDP